MARRPADGESRIMARGTLLKSSLQLYGMILNDFGNPEKRATSWLGVSCNG